jgi:signal peptidase II
VIFSESTFYDKAILFPEGGGYASLLHGKVVDMLYFPLIEGTFPSWFPIWGGEDFLFFRPVFNIADSAISVGVFLILIFQKRYFKEEHIEKESVHSEVVED